MWWDGVDVMSAPLFIRIKMITVRFLFFSHIHFTVDEWENILEWYTIDEIQMFIADDVFSQDLLTDLRPYLKKRISNTLRGF